MIFKRLFQVAIIFSLTNLPVSAVTYLFSGTWNGGPFVWWNQLVGTTFEGSFTYEFPQSMNTSGTYTAQNISLLTGTESISLTNITYTNSINIQNDASNVGDGFSLMSTANDSWNTGASLFNLPVSYLIFDLGDNTGTAFAGLDLVYELQLNKFSSAQLFFVSDTMNYGTGSIDSLSLVPEPSALSLLAVGLGGLAMVRRRRS